MELFMNGSRSALVLVVAVVHVIHGMMEPIAERCLLVMRRSAPHFHLGVTTTGHLRRRHRRQQDHDEEHSEQVSLCVTKGREVNRSNCEIR